jgi:hypothetical protein
MPLGLQLGALTRTISSSLGSGAWKQFPRQIARNNPFCLISLAGTPTPFASANYCVVKQLRAPFCNALTRSWVLRFNRLRIHRSSSHPMRKYQAQIRAGMRSIKLGTWLIPSFPRPLTANPPMMKAGSADAIRNCAAIPG